MSAKSTEFSRRIERILQNNAERLLFYASLEELAKTKPIVLRRHELRRAQLAEYGAWVERPLPWAKNAFFAKASLRDVIKKHPYVQSGALYWQEGAAVEAVELLNPAPDDQVADLCAAPGSKATQIVERLASGAGWLVANEWNRSRATKLGDILSRHGSLWSTVTSMSGEDFAERFPEAFDKVLLDAPCSGESLYAKRNDSRADIRDREVRECVRIQRKLLQCALAVCKAGGRILYSTCTYSLEENEELIRSVLSEIPGAFKIVCEQRRWPHVDRVPGGYFALLEKQGTSPERGSKDLVLNDWQGVIRSAGQRWDEEIDDYAWMMCEPDISVRKFQPQRARRPYVPAHIKEIELADSRLAESLFSGQAISIAGLENGALYRVRFKGVIIGGGRAVEGRLNNYLPKGLRLLG